MAVGDNSNIAISADKKLEKIDSITKDGSLRKEIMHGVCTDAGGGGTREELAVEMSKNNRTCDSQDFLITTCTLHAMNRMM